MRLSALIAVSVTLIAGSLCLGEGKPFRITVVDKATQRGVPLIELTTTGNITFITDSAGVIAFDEPGMTGATPMEVYFSVKGHGYTYPKDGFGFAGVKLQAVAGGSAKVEVERVNIAERLYRMTGAGIYRDSVMLGDRPPIQQPVLNGLVTGQDSVQNAVYKGKLYWFWGDTGRVAYPLGQFSMSGAWSDLPGKGGLDPSVGVDLHYFVGADGFSRPMLPIHNQPGAVWADGFLVTTDPATGAEKMLCHWIRVKDLGTIYEQGIAEYNDAKEVFEPTTRFALDAPLYMRGHPVRVRDEASGQEYFYFPFPYPFTRVKADYASVTDLSAYEAFTCLKAGARYDKANPAIERGSDGKPVWGWKRDTAPIGIEEQNQMIQGGFMKAEEGLIQTRDVDSGKAVQIHSSSVFWNEYRKRWIMIGQQVWGTSALGEVWFLEADSPIGPWVYAKKIVTHDNYTFYNVRQHPEFDQEGGKIVYFEGTYTTFMTKAAPTPRYDYNQVMYRLDLSDPKLALPVGVYGIRDSVIEGEAWPYERLSLGHWNPSANTYITQLRCFVMSYRAGQSLPANAGIFGNFSAGNTGPGIPRVIDPSDTNRLSHMIPLGWVRAADSSPAGVSTKSAQVLTGRWVGSATFSTGGDLELPMDLVFEGEKVAGAESQQMPRITDGKLVNGQLTLTMKNDDKTYVLTGTLDASAQTINATWHEEGSASADGAEPLSGTWTARKQVTGEAIADANLVPLWEYTSADGEERFYSTRDSAGSAKRGDQPLCMVWENPYADGFVPVEWGIVPVK